MFLKLRRVLAKYLSNGFSQVTLYDFDCTGIVQNSPYDIQLVEIADSPLDLGNRSINLID